MLRPQRLSSVTRMASISWALAKNATRSGTSSLALVYLLPY